MNHSDSGLAPAISRLSRRLVVLACLTFALAACGGGDGGGGTRMSWVRGPSSYGSLLIAPVSDPLASTELGTNTLSSQLENGILYWKDRDLVLRVYDGSTTTQLAGYAMTDHNLLQDGRTG